MLNRKIYNKPALSLKEQITLLENRGLLILEKEKTENYLRFIGYYRLSGYMIPFYEGKNKFKDGTTFSQIIDLYNFDRELRLIIFDTIEMIEVALRAVLTDTLSLQYNPHWFMDSGLFEEVSRHTITIETIRKSTIESSFKVRDNFISHYYHSYSTPDLPPSWMTLETLTIGTLSVIFKSLKRDIRKVIATQFQLDEIILSSWLHALAYTRNLAAHHSRIWNRKFTIKPKILRRHKNLLTDDSSIFSQYIMIGYLLKIIIPHYNLKSKFLELFFKYNKVDITQMGFPSGWQHLSIE